MAVAKWELDFFTCYIVAQVLREVGTKLTIHVRRPRAHEDATARVVIPVE